jgi:transposase
MSATCQYETDVTDAQWEILHPLLPTPTWTPGSRGRPPRPLRRVVNGMLYVNKTGCQWRMLPKGFGPWETVYGYFGLPGAANRKCHIPSDLVVDSCPHMLRAPQPLISH